MEILIPGLILVALMVYASTKIKRRAAAAFDEELVENEAYVIRKPEGFLHVLGSEAHEFEAYSREFSEGDDAKSSRATIEIDAIREDFDKACHDVGSNAEIIYENSGVARISTNERANESSFRVVYKLIDGGEKVYRLRFAVVDQYVDEFSGRLEDALCIFHLRTGQDL